MDVRGVDKKDEEKKLEDAILEEGNDSEESLAPLDNSDDEEQELADQIDESVLIREKQPSSVENSGSEHSDNASLPSDDKACLDKRLTHQSASNLMQVQPQFNKPQIKKRTKLVARDKKLSEMGEKRHRLTLGVERNS